MDLNFHVRWISPLCLTYRTGNLLLCNGYHYLIIIIINNLIITNYTPLLQLDATTENQLQTNSLWVRSSVDACASRNLVNNYRRWFSDKKKPYKISAARIKRSKRSPGWNLPYADHAIINRFITSSVDIKHIFKSQFIVSTNENNDYVPDEYCRRW